jgi:single-strand DNA-binding protein
MEVAMASLNRVQLIGRLGKDPETRTVSKGKIIATFSLAVDRRWRGEDGVVQHETDWFQVESWGSKAEFCQKYAHKGQLVFVEGRLRTDRYESQGETKYFTKVVARDIQLLEFRSEDHESEEVEETQDSEN